MITGKGQAMIPVATPNLPEVSLFNNVNAKMQAVITLNAMLWC